MKTVCKVLSFIGLLSLMVVGFAGLSALGAAETSPEVRIAHHNLAFTDEVCLLYAVEAEGTGGAAPFMEFRVGNDDLSTPDAVCRTYEYRPLEEGDGQNYYIFAFDGLNAAQMADTVYARAGVTVDGTTYYGKTDSYSVCEYAARKLGLKADAGQVVTAVEAYLHNRPVPSSRAMAMDSEPGKKRINQVNKFYELR